MNTRSRISRIARPAVLVLAAAAALALVIAEPASAAGANTFYVPTGGDGQFN